MYGQLPLFGAKLFATALGEDDYQHLNVAGRRLSALIDVGTIVLVFLLGRIVFARLGETGGDGRLAPRRGALRGHRHGRPVGALLHDRRLAGVLRAATVLVSARRGSRPRSECRPDLWTVEA